MSVEYEFKFNNAILTAEAKNKGSSEREYDSVGLAMILLVQHKDLEIRGKGSVLVSIVEDSPTKLSASVVPAKGSEIFNVGVSANFPPQNINFLSAGKNHCTLFFSESAKTYNYVIRYSPER